MTDVAKLILLASIAMPLGAQAVPEQAAAHAQAAQDAERRNDFPAAVREYEYVTAHLPQSAEMQSNLGVALYFNNELTRAIAVFQKATALNRELVAPHLFSGLAWYRLSNPHAAVPELEQAVHIDPVDVLAHTWLGYAYSAQLRYSLALKEFQAACRLDPGNVDVWYALGQTYLKIGKAATLDLLAIAPDGGRTWQLAGEQSELQGNRRQALQNFKGALARRPDIPELRVKIAELGGPVTAAAAAPRSENPREDDLYRQAHEAEQKSRAAFERVVQIAPDSYRAHQIMAEALSAQQRQDEAIEEYRTVLKLKPDLPDIHQAIGNIRLESGKLSEALNEFDSELQIQPESTMALTNVAKVLILLGGDDRAEQMLTKALRMHRPPPDAYRLLGKLDLRRNQYRSAVNVLTHYISMRGNDSSAYYLLSQAYRGLGDIEAMHRALALYEKTSQNAKARSRAQRELEARNDQIEPNTKN